MISSSPQHGHETRNIWATSCQNQQNGMCAQRRLRSASASAQSDQSSLSAWRKLGSLATHWGHSEDSDQTGQMPRLIWVLAGHTCHFVGFDMRQEIFDLTTWRYARKGKSNHSYQVKVTEVICQARWLDWMRIHLVCGRLQVRSSLWQHSFLEIGHEIISMAICSLPLIQEGQLSVTGKRMCTKYW